MEYFLGKSGPDVDSFQVEVYDQKLQLIYSGRLGKEQKSKIKSVLNGCSLLFNIHNTGYFLKQP